MTDKNDEIELEQEAPLEDNLDQEDSLDAEDWQDELPPEDDFHDHEDYQDEVPLDEDILEEELEALDEAEELYEDETGEDDQAAAKKRGRNVFLAVVGAGVIAAGGLAYMQFGGGSTPTMTRPITSLLDIREVRKAPVLAGKKDQTDVAPSTGKLDMVSLYQAGKAGKEVALPIPGASNKLKVKKDGADKDGVILSDVMITEVRKPVLPKSSMPMPKKEEIAKVEEIKSLPVKAVEPQPLPVKVVEDVKPSVLPSPVKTADAKPSAESEKRLTDMATQIDVLTDTLDKATQENAKLISKMETIQKKAAPDQSLQDRVVQLEAQLAAKEAELKEKARPVKAKKKVVRVKKATPEVKKVVKKRWILRGATPDSAWISPSSHSKELRRVTVGEKAPTIGKVKEIRQKGQKWLVIGTKGTIR